MTTTAWWCLLHWQIWTSGGAFEQEGSGWGEGGTGGATQSVRGNYQSCKGTKNVMVVEGMHQLII